MTRRALGRGLEALIPTRSLEHEPESRAAASVDRPTGTALEVDIDRIRPNRNQPRERFDDDKLEGLARSMREQGILQPLVVSPRDEGFELVAGERRWRAARLAGLTRVPVLLRNVDDREALELSILENVQREDLNPIEEARGYRRLGDEFGMTQEEIAAKVGKSRSAIANALRLLRLPPEVQQRIQTGELTAGHARALLAAGTTEEQTELALLVRERGLNVREAEAEARARRRPAAASAPVNPALAELEHRLEVRFGTRVRIRARKADGTSGRIEIEYYDAADLERIFDAAGASYLL